MAIKKFKSTSPARRWASGPEFTEITKTKPEKSLLRPLKKSGGRNTHGHITVRRRGGGHKRALRLIDFRRNKSDIPAKVIAIEYDPNRSARLALLQYPDGQRCYIIAPSGLKVNDEVISCDSGEIKPGNCLPLRIIPPGVPIHNIELVKEKGGQIVRSAGSSAQILAKEAGLAHLKLPSGEVRLVPLDCKATVGQVGNAEHKTVSLGKAGRSRHSGKRPHTRGVAMNPVDHPHGGGEGKAPQGSPHPVSPWGKPAKGFKTRKKRKVSDKYILKRRR